MININVNTSYVNMYSLKIFLDAYYIAVANCSRKCRTCKSLCHFHGSYTRKTPLCIGPILIQRVYCKSCKKSHALLPCYIVPYARVLAIIKQAVISQIAVNIQTIEEIAELFEVDPTTIARWWMIFRNKSNSLLAALSKYLASSPGLTDWVRGDIRTSRRKAQKILELMGRFRSIYYPDFSFCDFSLVNISNSYLLSGMR